ncbi:hypothetical protein GETHLI_11970 [Geothrix limicola]|uniref:Uncharacterized protein n=1 Tax=Geothrix limicola TaxID=2927978 RepID=A0ABQ5QEW9_9BACT|nr:DUF3892 domain-containing protein [Geothrix limicola]GLH72695.1 hypothetical protein GETHLI_11970 [Geothrix limicola]
MKSILEELSKSGRRPKLKWEAGKGQGVVPAHFGKARHLEAKPPTGKTFPGGRDLVIETFNNAGDAPSTTTVKDGGGKKLRNATINLIFWGDAWTANPPPSPTLSEVVNDAASILAGPYQLRISQYGATPARLGGIFVSVPGNNPPTHFQTSDVQDLITSAIAGGALPEPDEETNDVIHCVFMPPGTNAPPNLGGLHTYANWSEVSIFPFDIDINDRSHLAWVAFGSRAFISSVFSHEVVEALSDPEGNGIQVNPTNSSNWNEIGDVCQSTGIVNGVTVQSYWSQSDKACVIPVNIPLTMQITFIHKNPRNDMFHPIRNVGGMNLTQNIPFRMTQQECIASIDRGNKFFVVGADGTRADVRVFIHFPPWHRQGIRYIATVEDNSKADNLLSLPEG